ncbi:MAG: transposase [Saprospiraceae bacterium]|nr:transposase [Saprospiraceae bacterium]
MNKFKGGIARAKMLDFSENGCYFITINLKGREKIFGDIIDEAMKLTKVGQIATDIWLEIPNKFPFIRLGAFVIMPDHFHGLLHIEQLDDGSIAPRLLSGQLIEETIHDLTKDTPGGITGYKNPMMYENISRVVRWFKGRSTFEIRKIETSFAWQPRFYCQIVFKKLDMTVITKYIQNNPKNWQKKS